MSNLVTTAKEKNMLAVESALVMNDISKLSTQERMQYYNSICESVGLNPLTKPFAFLTLQGKTVLYATKDCSEQLRKIHGVSTQIVSMGIVDGMYEVHIRAVDKTGRTDEDISVIPMDRAQGNDLANLKLKAITKAKRRVTLSICGLGMLDESELETIPREAKGFSENPQIALNHPLKKTEEAIDSLPKHVEDALLENVSLGDYVCQFGAKYKGKKLSEIDPVHLNNYLDWLSNSAKEQNKPLNGSALELCETGQAYLNSLETAEMYKEEN